MTDAEPTHPGVAVVGLGLVGGSVALAVRERLGAVVVGWDPDPAALAYAREHGVVDVAAPDLPAAVAGAGLVVVAAPLGALRGAVAEVLAAAGQDTVVTDVGSTKAAIAERFQADGRFVGGHPLAGAETTGVAQARSDLFDGARWYLTPHGSTTGTLYERLHRFVAALGARPAAIDPADHDQAMAGVSHLPHVLANVLVSHVGAAAPAEEPVPAIGPSFRDATRVAGANPALWADIYLANAPAVLAAVDDTILRLQAARGLIAAGDHAGLAAWQQQVADERAALMAASAGSGSPRELRVAVTNRPGVMAEIALALGRAGITISDLSVAPTADNSAGVIALWVDEQDLERAAALARDLGHPVTT